MHQVNSLWHIGKKLHFPATRHAGAQAYETPGSDSSHSVSLASVISPNGTSLRLTVTEIATAEACHCIDSKDINSNYIDARGNTL